ncbi:LysE family translocator [filamentous cyanobacterium LEGE 11480]|uniref:LysE family translocator n=1 Tax=Romeriopsis navalis LEGE 11480 TaxID=2777977 RepID=A0A928VSZ5_9CYAN|nr:LysE family translocator [Romeriopsis navalis]MBE9031990.1 LysE family translocator [Romeriopsis navalis LEGE 11480]
MTVSSVLALFGAMVVLAALPSMSVLTVVSRSISAGLLHGAMTAIGIVLGDILFIVFAIYGLSAIAIAMGSVFMGLKYLGAAYLIWLGMSLLRAKSASVEIETTTAASWVASLLSGLLITVGDQKAVLFYMGFLPAFLDLSQVSIADTGILIATTTIAVGGVKIVYAVMADRARSLFRRNRLLQGINYLAGAIMIGTGIGLIIGAHG